MYIVWNHWFHSKWWVSVFTSGLSAGRNSVRKTWAPAPLDSTTSGDFLRKWVGKMYSPGSSMMMFWKLFFGTFGEYLPSIEKYSTLRTISVASLLHSSIAVLILDWLSLEKKEWDVWAKERILKRVRVRGRKSGYFVLYCMLRSIGFAIWSSIFYREHDSMRKAVL